MKTKFLIYGFAEIAIAALYLIIPIYSFLAFIVIAICNSEYWSIVVSVGLIFLIFCLSAFIWIQFLLTSDILTYKKEEREKEPKVVADNYINPFQKENDQMFDKHKQQMEDLKQVLKRCLSTIGKYLRLQEYERLPYTIGNLSKEDAALIIESCGLLIQMKADGIGMTEPPLTMDVVDFVKSLRFGITRGEGSNWTLTFKEDIIL